MVQTVDLQSTSGNNYLIYDELKYKYCRKIMCGTALEN